MNSNTLEMQETQKIKQNSLELIGNTPMLRLSKIVPPDAAEVCAKLEWYNIGASIKDRMALRLIENAEKKGELRTGKTLIEATSGNTGIALAMICAIKGYALELVMPDGVSVERRKIIKAHGAKLVLSDGKMGTGGAIELKLKLLKENPEKYIALDQFNDPANINTHYSTTAKEILDQTNGNLDMVIMGIGTAGTGVGISKRLKEHNPEIKIVGVIPEFGAQIQGLRNPYENYPTKLYNSGYFDEIVEIKKEEIPKTYEVAQELARKEGLLVGMSSAAAMYVAKRKASILGVEKRIVVIFPDNGLKYLSTPLFGE